MVIYEEPLSWILAKMALFVSLCAYCDLRVTYHPHRGPPTGGKSQYATSTIAKHIVPARVSRRDMSRRCKRIAQCGL